MSRFGNLVRHKVGNEQGGFDAGLLIGKVAAALLKATIKLPGLAPKRVPEGTRYRRLEGRFPTARRDLPSGSRALSNHPCPGNRDR